MQGHPGPGERQQLLAVAEADEADGLHGGVEQGRMHAVVLGVVDLARQGDLDERLVAAPPDGAQPLEDGAVLGAVVEALEVGGDGAARGPDTRVEGGGALAGGEDAVGVFRPALLRVVHGLRVDGDLAGAGLVRGADPHLDDGGGVLGEDERFGEGEFVDAVAADLVAGADGEFQEAGGREGDDAADRVVHQPGVGLRRETSGEQDPVESREGDRGAQQGVFGGDEAGGRHVAGGGHQDWPVPLVLPRVGGQVGAARAGPVEAAGPVDAYARDVEPGQRGEQGAFLGAVLAQGGRGHGVGGAVEHLRGHRGQDAVGTQFQEGVGAGTGQGAHAVGEAHGFPYVAHPVVGRAQQLRAGDLTGQVGDDRDERLVVGQCLRDVAEGVEHRLHQRRVEGVTHRKALRLASMGGELGCEREDFGLDAGDDHGVRAVDRGHRHAAGQLAGDLLLGGLERHHGAAGREVLHQPGAGGDQRAGVVQGQDARHVGGGDLADRVASDELRCHAPRLDEPVERDLDGEQRGLGVAGGVEEFRLGGAASGEDDVAQRPVEFAVEPVQYGVEGFGEHGEAGVQFTAHAGPLGALAGEQDGQ
ncbi:hypothetical protein APS67_006606 [Streptomyces sp. AVP053U2]|nr:hypothetical protein APS67_006606 [Streptomyces sp. AVP053U2]